MFARCGFLFYDGGGGGGDVWMGSARYIQLKKKDTNRLPQCKSMRNHKAGC